MKNITKKNPCEGCHYWRYMHPGHACLYLYITGTRRGCDPGENCIRKKPINAKELQKEKNTSLTRDCFDMNTYQKIEMHKW